MKMTDELIREVQKAVEHIKEQKAVVDELKERVENIEKALARGINTASLPAVEGATAQERLENFALMDSDNPEVRKAQDLWDAYVVFAMLRRRKGLEPSGWLERRFRDLVVKIAGSDLPGYIPTGFSARIFQLVRLQPSVAKVFETIDLPSEIYKPAIQLSGITVYGVDPEAQVTLSTPSAPNVEFRAKKIAAAVTVADEVTEDSIVPIVPVLQAEFAYAFADAVDKVILKGDTTSQDSLLKLWDGLLKLSANPNQGAQWDAATVRASLAALDVVNPNEIVLIVNQADYADMLGWSEVLTVDKYGAAATILTGELAKVFGVPVVVSPHATNPVVVLHRCFKLGVRRGVKVETDRDVLRLRDVLVASMRVDFKKVSGNNVGKKVK